MNLEKTLIYLTDDLQDLSQFATLNDLPNAFKLLSSKDDFFSAKILRFNNEILKICLRLSGLKEKDASFMSKKLFQSLFSKAIEFFGLHSEEYVISLKNNGKILVLKSFFLNLLKSELKHKWVDKFNFDKFEISLLMFSNNINMVILLGGTAGVGKSSIATNLATKTGILTVISTDSLRHITSNFVEKDMSHYESGKKLQSQNFAVNEKQKILKAYEMQAIFMQEKIDCLIQEFIERKKSIIIEGVHLTPDFMMKMTQKYENCFSFLIFISNESKHKEGFAERTRDMCLDNKFIEVFKNIKNFQKFLVKKANEKLISKIDNFNIEIATRNILETVMNYFRKIYIKKKPIPSNKNQCIYRKFNKITKNIWSSQIVKEFITSEVNRVELLKMKLENLIQNDRFIFEESFEIEKIEILPKSGPKAMESENVKSFDESLDVNLGSVKESDSNFSFREFFDINENEDDPLKKEGKTPELSEDENSMGSIEIDNLSLDSQD